MLKNALGGEIFVPKLQSYRITDLAKAIGPNCRYPIVGVRQGEKIHEEMITARDSQNTLELKNIYVILPSKNNNFLSYYKKKFNSSKVKKDFTYKSNSTNKFLSINDLKKILKDYEKKN